MEMKGEPGRRNPARPQSRGNGSRRSRRRPLPPSGSTWNSEESAACQAVANAGGCHLSLTKRWSSRHRWRERVEAWEQRQRRQEVTETWVREAAYERRLHHAEQLEKVAMAGLRSLLVRDPETAELRFDRRLKPTEIAALIRVACQLLPTPPAAAETDESDHRLELSWGAPEDTPDSAQSGPAVTHPGLRRLLGRASSEDTAAGPDTKGD